MSGIELVTQQLDLFINQDPDLATKSELNSEQLEVVKNILKDVNLESSASRLEAVTVLEKNSEYVQLIHTAAQQLHGETRNLDQLDQDLQMPSILKGARDDILRTAPRDLRGNMGPLNEIQQAKVDIIESYSNQPEKIRNAILQLSDEHCTAEIAAKILKELFQHDPVPPIASAVLVSAVNKYEIDLRQIGFKTITQALNAFGGFQGNVTCFKLSSFEGRGATSEEMRLLVEKIPHLKQLAFLFTPLDSQMMRSICELRELETLSLLSNSLKFLPPEIQNLSKLKELNISYNSISIPKEIGSLTRLEKLICRECELRRLPSEIGQLKSLQTLDLAENAFSKLPPEIISLTSLKKLDLAVNAGISLEGIGQLHSLETLNLTRCRLNELPKEIGNLSNLKTLNLEFCQLKTLPEEFAKLTALKELNLGFNAGIKFDLETFLALETLDLTNCSLDSLPEKIPSSLQYLFLGDNNFSSFPDSVLTLHALKMLKLSYNQIHSLPEAIDNLSQLEHLDLSQNTIDSLPGTIGALSQLKDLDLNRNHITQLPDSIGNLTNLHTLNLGSNSIDELPPSMANLTHIRTVGDSTLDFELEVIRGEEERSLDDLQIDLDPATIPIEYGNKLIEMSSKVNESFSGYEMHFTGGIGQDAGGLTREAHTRIYGVFSHHHTDQKFPTLRNVEREGEIIKAAGKCLAFVAWCEGQFPVGDIFRPGVFDVLANCPNEVVTKSFDTLSAEEMLSLLDETQKKHFRLNAMEGVLNAMNGKEASQFTKEIKDYFDELYEDIPGNPITTEGLVTDENLPALQRHLRTYITSQTTHINRAKAMHYLLQGFSEIETVWAERANLDLESLTQGKFSKDAFLEHLVSEGDTAMDLQYLEWVKEWISNKDDPIAQDLLEYATGARSLRPDLQGEMQPIGIRLRPVDVNTGAHTCSGIIELPMDLSQEQVFAELEIMRNQRGYTMR